MKKAKYNFLLKIFVYCFFGIIQNPLLALEPVVLSTTHGKYILGKYIEILEDKSKKLTIEKVSTSPLAFKFSPSLQEKPNHGYTNSAFWVRFQLQNNHPHNANWLLEIDYPLLDAITLYLPKKNGSWRHKKGGDLLPFFKREVRHRNPVFLLRFPERGKTTEVYLRIVTESPMQFPLTVWNPVDFSEKVYLELYGLGLFYGIILAMIIYNLFIFSSVKSRTYLYYVLYIVSFVFFQMSINGLAFQFLWPESTWWTSRSVPFLLASSGIWYSLFSISFLNMKENTRLLYRILYLIMALFILTMVLSITAPYSICIKIAIILAFSTIIVTIIAGFRTWIGGYRPARFYILAFTGLSLSVIVFGVMTLGLLPRMFMTEYGLQIGSALDVMLLSLALADRINGLRDEKEKAQNWANEALASKNEELLRLDRLKDDFLANTSHELRTPLNGIIGIADSMLHGIGGPFKSEAKTNLEMITSSGMRLSNLVNDILDFSKLKQSDLILKKTSVDIHALVEIVFRLSKPLLGNKEIALFNGCRDFPLVHADENRLEQIIYNLVGNAIKFTKKGIVEVSAKIKDDFVEVSVRDSGIGIPKEKQKVIFESFQQADGSISRSYGGTGLGLSVTKKLIELHDGEIRVESPLKQTLIKVNEMKTNGPSDSPTGKGSCFIFTIPLADSESRAIQTDNKSEKIRYYIHQDDSIEEKRSSEIQKNLDGKNIQRILAVDDDVINLQVIVNHLSIQNYYVEKAQNGTEALSILEKGEKFDLILLDLMMPGMNGFEVCQRIRQKYKPNELPVIILTAKNNQSDLTESLNFGANDYLTKPFSFAELISRSENQLKMARFYREIQVLNQNLELEVEKRTKTLEDTLEKLKSTQTQLIHSEKMAGLGTLVAGLAHEINNPVNYVHTNAFSLINEIKDFEKYVNDIIDTENEENAEIHEGFKKRFEKYLDIVKDIDEGSKRIKTIIDDLRSFSRIEDKNFRRANIMDGLKSTVRIVKSQFKDSVTFEENFAADPLIKCIPSQINQVFMNVLTNACQAVEEKIRWSLSRAESRDSPQGKSEPAKFSTKIKINTLEENSNFIIEIMDHGIGMDDDTKKKIFEPFFTTKEPGKGTGMGMAISYGIIEKHKGRIEVESMKGMGTTFKIVLPLFNS